MYKLSALGLIFLLWLYLILSIAIVISGPGPVMFRQKRVGIHKTFFQLHKFRLMKMSTPHDMPTHMLENPEQYITNIGQFLRKSSLDERVIIGQTTESLENKGFREVSPYYFHRGHDLLFYNAEYANIWGILCQSA